MHGMLTGCVRSVSYDMPLLSISLPLIALGTMNVNSECGGPDDVYFYSPWRAPGAAPVIDSCGVAGGRHAGQGGGGAGTLSVSYKIHPSQYFHYFGNVELQQDCTMVVVVVVV